MTEADSQVVYWFVDDIYLGNSFSKQALEWRPTEKGRYRIRAIDEFGRADSRTVTVELTN